MGNIIKVRNNINGLIIDSVKPEQLENLEELKSACDSRNSFYKQRLDIFENLQSKMVLIVL